MMVPLSAVSDFRDDKVLSVIGEPTLIAGTIVEFSKPAATCEWNPLDHGARWVLASPAKSPTTMKTWNLHQLDN